MNPKQKFSTEIVEFQKTEAGLADLRDRYGAVPDASTPEGYELCRAGVAELRSLRTGLDKMRLALNADDQARIKLRNGEAKRITAALVSLEGPLKEAKAAVDEKAEREKREAAEKEAARVEAIEAKLSALTRLQFCEQSVPALNEAIARAQDFNPGDGSFGEYQEAAEKAQAHTLDVLTGYLEKAAAAEREAQAVAEEAARQQAERDRLAAERAEIDKQRRELAAAQAEGIRKAEEAARLEREEKEKAERLEREEKEKAERLEREEKEAAARKIQEEREKAERLAKMQADRERFAADARVLISFASNVEMLREEITAYPFSTMEGGQVRDALLANLEAAINGAVESDVVRSLDTETEAA